MRYSKYILFSLVKLQNNFLRKHWEDKKILIAIYSQPFLIVKERLIFEIYPSYKSQVQI